MGRHEEAIKHFDKALQINPQYDPAYASKGMSLGKIGQNDEAIKNLKKAEEMGSPMAKQMLEAIIREEH